MKLNLHGKISIIKYLKEVVDIKIVVKVFIRTIRNNMDQTKVWNYIRTAFR